MSAEVSLLTQISNNTDFYAVSDTLFDPNLMLDMSGAFPNRVSKDSTGVHDIFKDGSAVATYQFNNDVTDLGGTYDGTPIDITYQAGKYDESSIYNGTSSVVDCNIDNAVEIDSVSIWFNSNLDVATEINCIGMMNQSDVYNWIMLGNGSGAITDETLSVLFYIQPSTTEFAYIKDEISFGWHNMVFQWEADAYYIYLDGVKRTTYYEGAINVRRPLDLILGRRYGAENYFDGQLDQVRIFNRALTADEILSLYNETSSPKIVLDLPQRPIVSTIDLVDPFSDSSGVSLYQFNDDTLDVSGSYNAIPVDITYGVGNFGNASVFNGTSSYVTYPAYALGDNFTVSAWINPVDFNHYVQVFSNWTQSNFALKIYREIDDLGGTLYVYTGGTGSIVSDLKVPLGVWSFVATTYVGGVVTMHLNDASFTTSMTMNIPSETHITGRRGDAVDEFLNGSIDQVRVFNRALTTEEINSIYNEEVTL